MKKEKFITSEEAAKIILMGGVVLGIAFLIATKGKGKKCTLWWFDDKKRVLIVQGTKLFGMYERIA